jgi:hypothetical protein
MEIEKRHTVGSFLVKKPGCRTDLARMKSNSSLEGRGFLEPGFFMPCHNQLKKFMIP